MKQKIFCVRIGNKYGPEYEDYLEKKLPNYDFHWIRKPFDDRVILQWNKMFPMSLDLDEPVIVMDIDCILINDYEKIFEEPIERGQFLAMPDWWNRGHEARGYTLNGGYFKYYPSDVKPIFDKFIKDPQKWQKHYIENGTTIGPVNGEQYFVEDGIREVGLDLKLLPNSWFTRWATEKAIRISHMWEIRPEDDYIDWQKWMNKRYTEKTGNEYLWLDEFHPDIKYVHFTHSANKPQDWDRFEEYL